MNYTLIRSRRKSLALFLQKDGSLIVRSPLFLSQKKINRFVESKTSWIESKQQVLIEHAAKREAFRLFPGVELLYLGKRYPLRISKGKDSGFDEQGFYVGNQLNEDQIKAKLSQLYKTLAGQIIETKVEDYARQFKLKPGSMRIGSARTLWGSCNSKNQLSFSWRLIMADESCVDYVVLHELAHTLEHNHSKRFWKKLSFMLPDYQTPRLELRVFGKQMQSESW